MIRMIVNEALAALAGDFSALCSRMGRPSIAPEKLLRAMLLQAFYSIRTERQLMERLEFDLLFRWFVGIGVDDAAWDHSTFSKNRDRLLEGDIAAKLSRAVLAQPRIKQLLSTDHFSVDGMKSFKPKDGDEPPADAGGRNRETDFHGQKRSNDTHASLRHRARDQWPFGRDAIGRAERALRGLALGRKSWLFAGSERGAERTALMYTLIQTAKLNDADPQAWLADVLARIADTPQTKLAELLPWNSRADPLRQKAA